MIGRTVSHYKILEQLGQGGMGVVYKALDLKLNRTVALKFLPPHLTQDQEAIERFINEAQAASALDHSNICTIHEINETEDGQMFIYMGYYGGETLEKKVISGQLPLGSVIDIAMQVAHGLERAHESGIIHRDIKPSNLIITPRGEVKIIDFGLAKLAGQSRLTKSGSTPGTVAYMSPEQVQSKTVDQRADIWSLGVVLYEMLTGQLPFRGENEAATIFSIVNESLEPFAHHRTDLSEGLQRMMDKALVKNPEARYQNMDDLLEDMKREKSGVSELIKPIAKVKKKQARAIKIILAATGLITVIIMVIALYLFLRPEVKQISPTHKQLTFTGDAAYPAISSDGQFIAYVTGKLGVQKVMVQDIAGGEALQVYHDYRCKYLRWSPDGVELVVQGDSAFEAILIPRLGGSFRRMPSFELLCWSPDGLQIASTSSYLKLIQITNKAQGKSARLFLQGSFTWLRSLDWSPLGNRLLFLSHDPKRYSIWTIKIDGSQQQKVVEDSLIISSPRWSADGKAIYYVRDKGQTKSLMKVAVAPKSGKADDSTISLLDGLLFGDYFTLSSDNKRLLHIRETQSSNLWFITLPSEGKKSTFEGKLLTTGTSWAHDPTFSPDGSQIAFSIGTRSRANLFVMPITGGPMQQLTFFNSYNAGPAWSSDGKEIAFGSTQEGRPKVWRIYANGGTPYPFMKSELSGDSFSLTWSPRANILYQRPGNNNFHLLNPQTEEEKALVENPPEFGWIFFPRYSPDTKSVVAYWNRLDKVGKRMPSSLIPN